MSRYVLLQLLAQISIPHWFYSNNVVAYALLLRNMHFNTTLVLFKRSFTNSFIKRCLNFNTTLVLFKHCNAAILTHRFFYFNTTLVLFKQHRDGMGKLNFQYFNTTLVLFKPRISFLRGLIFLVFQYHTGSIQTKPTEVTYSHNVTISIPHWFYSNCANSCSKTYLLTHFNTTLVLFKRRRWDFWVSLQDNFNTTLVLFKQWQSLQLSNSSNKFQYHTGSIQTNIPSSAYDLDFDISIPHWFYSNDDYDEVCPGCNRISIPHWFYSNNAPG